MKKQAIRLFWGENYAPKPKAVMDAIQKALEASLDAINLYPGDVYGDTKKLLAKKYHISSQCILLQNGIESILPPLFKAYVQKKDEVITFDPTFICYKENVDVLGGKIIGISVGLEKDTTAKEILSKITQQTKMICLAWPNTTTGRYHIAKKDIEEILEKFNGLVVIDECYFGIGKQTVLPLIKKYPNLLVLRGVSKNWGLAGIRLGWAIGNRKTIKNIEAYSLHLAKDPISLPSYYILQAVLPYAKLLEKSFIQYKHQFEVKLAKIPGMQVYPSVCTFIPFRIKRITSNAKIKKVIATLAQDYGILIKDTSYLGYFLIGIPAKDEWQYVIDSLQKILKNF